MTKDSTDTSEWDALTPEQKALVFKREGLESRGKMVRHCLVSIESHLEALGFTPDEIARYKEDFAKLDAAIRARVEEGLKALASA